MQGIMARVTKRTKRFTKAFSPLVESASDSLNKRKVITRFAIIDF